MKIILIIVLCATFVLSSKESRQQEIFPDSALIVLVNANNMIGDTLKGMIIPVNSELWTDQFVVDGLDTSITTKWDNGILYIRKPITATGVYKIRSALIIKADSVESRLPFSSQGVTLPKPVAIGVTKYLIKDIENPIEISAAGIPFFELTVTCADAELINSGGGSYKIIPHSTGLLNIDVKWNHGNAVESLNTLTFEVVEKK